MFEESLTGKSTFSIADVNMDGYPDILVTLEKEGKFRSHLYFNVRCDDCVNKTRKLEQSVAFSKVVEEFYPVVSASFFDLGEDGALDIILNVKGPGSASQIVTIMNNLK